MYSPYRSTISCLLWQELSNSSPSPCQERKKKQSRTGLSGLMVFPSNRYSSPSRLQSSQCICAHVCLKLSLIWQKMYYAISLFLCCCSNGNLKFMAKKWSHWSLLSITPSFLLHGWHIAIYQLSICQECDTFLCKQHAMFCEYIAWGSIWGLTQWDVAEDI